MNILMVLKDMSVCGDVTCVIDLSKELIRRGNKVVIAAKVGDLTPQLENLNIKYYSVALDSKTPGGILKANKVLEQIVKEENINIVHYHSLSVSYILNKFCKKHNLPLVATTSLSFDFADLKLMAKRSRKILVKNENQKKYLVENCKVPQSDALVTVNGVDGARFCENADKCYMQEKFCLNDEDNVVVHICRLDKKHGLIAHRLIQAVLKLDNIVENLKCVIVGGGDDFENVKKVAEAANEKMGRDAVLLAGMCTDVEKYIAPAKLFVGESRSAMEAMASGKPVILAGYDGYIGLFTDENAGECIEKGFSCHGCQEPGVDALSQDIGAFFGLWDEEQEALCELGRQTMRESFSAKRMGDDAENAYKSVLEE